MFLFGYTLHSLRHSMSTKSMQQMDEEPIYPYVILHVLFWFYSPNDLPRIRLITREFNNLLIVDTFEFLKIRVEVPRVGRGVHFQWPTNSATNTTRVHFSSSDD